MSNKVSLEVEILGKDGSIKKMTASIANLDDAIKEVVQSAQKVPEKLNGWGASAVVFSSLNQIVGGLNDQIQKVAESFNSFDKSMRAANTMAGLNEEQFGQMKDSISELGKVIPKTREELANGLYEVISNGVPEDNWLSFLEASAKASVGGIADLGQTVTVTSTIIKNYGLSWEKAADIQDKIQMTAKNGKTSFEELAAALPRVTGSAATLGVSIDELMATFATLTGVSGNTAEVSTQLSAIFTALIKPSSEAAKMAEEMGIKFDASVIQAAGGMDQFLSQLDECVKEYSASSGVLETEVYGRLFGSAEAVRALIPITGNLSEKYSQNVEAMANATGTAGEAFNQMSQTGEAHTTMWRNNLAAMFDWIGGIASTAAPMTGFITNIGQTIISLKAVGSAVKAAGSVLIGYVVELHKTAAAQGKSTASLIANKVATIAHTVATKAAKAATAAWSAVQKVFNVILTANPIGLIVTAVGALVAIIAVVCSKIEGWGSLWDGICGYMKYSFYSFVDAVKLYFTTLVNGFMIGLDKIKLGWYKFKEACGIGDSSENRAAIEAINADIEERQQVIIDSAKAVKENGEKAVESLKGIQMGWKKDTDECADALEGEAEAANKTAAAYDKVKQKRGSIKLAGGSAQTTTGSSSKSSGKTAAPKGSIAAIDARIQSLRTELSLAIDTDSRAKVQTELDNLEAEKHIIELETRLKMDGIDSIRDALPQVKLEPIDITVTGLPGLKAANTGLVDVRQNEQKLDTTQKKVARDGKKLNEVMDATGQLTGNTSEAIRALTKDGNNAAAAWIDYGAAVAQSCAQMVTSFMSLIPAKQAEEQQSKKNTTANVAEASSGYFAAHAEIPFVGIVLALAAVAGMIATIMSLPKFAAGGIAYGPTMGLFGEYPGAANNPEVVAPLSKLKSLLNTDSGTGGRVEFEIKGRRLVGVLAKENNVMARR